MSNDSVSLSGGDQPLFPSIRPSVPKSDTTSGSQLPGLHEKIATPKEAEKTEFTGSKSLEHPSTDKTQKVVKTSSLGLENQNEQIQNWLIEISQNVFTNLENLIKDVTDGMISSMNDEEEFKKYNEIAKQIQLFPNLPSYAKKEIINSLKLSFEIAESKSADGVSDFGEACIILAKKFGITEAEIKAELHIYGEEKKTLAVLKMLRRALRAEQAGIDLQSKGSIAKRMEITGYPLSVVMACEKMFFRMKNKEVGQVVVEGFVITPFNKGILVEEKEVDRGAFKIVLLASNFFELKKTEDRRAFVTKKPDFAMPIIPQAQEEVASQENKYKPVVWMTPSGMQQAEFPTVLVHGANEKDSTVKIKQDSNTAIQTTIIHGDSLRVEDEKVIPETLIQKVEEKPILESSVQKEEVKPEGTMQKTEEKPVPESSVQNKETSTNLQESEFQTSLFTLPSVFFHTADDLSIFELEAERLGLVEDEAKAYIRYLKEIEYHTELEGPYIENIHIIAAPNGLKVMVADTAGYSVPYTYASSGQIEVKNLNELNSVTPIEKRSIENQIFMLEKLLEVAKGLSYIHQQGIVHNDIKPDNILLTKNGTAQLSDFGAATKYNENEKTMEGTLYFIAPERMTNALSTPKSDVWSFGMMAHILTQKNYHPFFEAARIPDPRKLGPFLQELRIRSFAKNEREQHDEYNENYKNKNLNPLQEIIWKATRIDPVERLSINEVIEKLEEYIDFLKALKSH